MPRLRDNFEPVSSGRDLNHGSSTPLVKACRATDIQLRAFSHAGIYPARNRAHTVSFILRGVRL